MDQKQPKCNAISSEELMQAQAEIWCLSYGYLKPVALRCAVKLGIADAIHRAGGAATLCELVSTIPFSERKRAHLSRLMRSLAALGVFTEYDDGPAAGAASVGSRASVVYRLTPVSHLLVDDAEASGAACLSPFAASVTAMSNITAYLRLDEWFRSEGDDGAAETPFRMAHGMDYWAAGGRDAQQSAGFNKELMGSDSRLVAEVVVREGGQVFERVTSLVDVGGGNGTMAKANPRAFPHVRCAVLDLAHVVDGVPGGDDGAAAVEFVAGDMIDFIPPSDAVLLKNVLHNWSDEDCVRILRRCRESISAGGPNGKVVIIEIVVGGPASKAALEAQLLMVMCMMVLSTSQERAEARWSKIFMDAGFSRYQIRPVLGARSIIEVYP